MSASPDHNCGCDQDGIRIPGGRRPGQRITWQFRWNLPQCHRLSNRRLACAGRNVSGNDNRYRWRREAGIARHTNPGFYPGNGDGTFRAQTAGIYAFATGVLALADFNGDGIVDFAMTDSEGLPISVYSGGPSPLVTPTASPDPANVGDDVVLTATSTLADATGTIAFNDKSAGVQGTGVLGTVGLINGSATLRLPNPARGIYSYQASYGGDSKYLPTARKSSR